ncbi:hypothetical protein LB941_11485 [Ligilactobacillus sp. WILCCON 0076]|uniref:Uncharacterized protein n=1 Tax=Ligilactobacillus ubinensis TaxID=2876789 RepID=A0A9X2JME2_9LACO|nr:hypothetical protein [Ligilactobacillus ubinensis]MCP0887953.1 hypothetical protein [Ligilactobacillus ubinensis]
MEKEFIISNILSKTDILIIGGYDCGIKQDDYFDIVDPNYSYIINPETNEKIMSIRRFKYRMKIQQIFQKTSRLTTLTKASSHREYITTSPNSLHKKKETLNINSDSKIEDIFAKYSYSPVSVGDTVLLARSSLRSNNF